MEHDNTKLDNIDRLIRKKNMQFREFSIGKLETRAADESNPEKLIIHGTPVTFDTPTLLYVNDKGIKCLEQIDRHAFDDCDMTDVIFNFNHSGRVFARTRNKNLVLTITDQGLEMQTELWNDDNGHLELYHDIKRGNLDKMSFAFTSPTTGSEFIYSEDGTEELRVIKKIDHLYDVSVVDIPAYDSTSISARRAFDAESERREAVSDLAESRKRALRTKIKIAKEIAERN